MKEIKAAILAGIGATVAIATLSFFDASLDELALLIAPFGATAVLVFGLPNSPLAQPSNVIFGHFITAFIGVLFVQFIEVSPLTLATATGLGVTTMMITKTTHPPAGANPLLIMLSGQSWSFLFSPVLLGAIIIVIIGKLAAALNKKAMSPA